MFVILRLNIVVQNFPVPQIFPKKKKSPKTLADSVHSYHLRWFNVAEDCHVFDSIYDICQASTNSLIGTVDFYVIPIWVIEFQVSTRVKLAGEQRGDKWDVGFGEKAKVLVGVGVGRQGGVQEDEAEESLDRQEDREDE
ncbi:hypothetical protein ACFXTH_040543 [Malus domestica]